eukprot:TRINITY_DN3241_c0_g1_i1.p1 TRINITY_DN3241_c0_g1~~TRINITY_DN3241_c0_g1_i1.p1  ORF type:complete len:516 (-),score=26.90 TRINITY_DN3241_c0_g1_i1:165-1712(-)
MIIVLLAVVFTLPQIAQAQTCNQLIHHFSSTCNTWTTFSLDAVSHEPHSGICCWNSDCCTQVRSIIENNCFDDCHSDVINNSTFMQLVAIHTTACLPNREIPPCLTDTDVFKSNCDQLAEDLLHNCGNNSQLIRHNQANGEYSACCWENSCCQRSREFYEQGCACVTDSRPPFYHFGSGIAQLWKQVCDQDNNVPWNNDDCEVQVELEQGQVNKGMDGDQYNDEYGTQIQAASNQTELVKIQSNLYRTGTPCSEQQVEVLLTKLQVCFVDDVFDMQKMPIGYVEYCCGIADQLTQSACEACSEKYQGQVAYEVIQNLQIWMESCPQAFEPNVVGSCSHQDLVHYFQPNPLDFIYDLEISSDPNTDMNSALSSIPMISIFNELLEIFNFKNTRNYQTILAPTNTAFASNDWGLGIPIFQVLAQENRNEIIDQKLKNVLSHHLVDYKVDLQQGTQITGISLAGEPLQFIVDYVQEQVHVSANCCSDRTGQIVAEVEINGVLLLVIDQVMYNADQSLP